MKVLIADRFPKKGLEDIQALGLEVDYRPEVRAKELAQAVAGASVLMVRGKEVKADVFEKGTSLSLVIRAGAGVNTIDVAAASRRGVYVANCPGQNSVAVAELAFGLLLSLDRRIPDNVIALREGRWEKKKFGEAAGLFGRTLGIFGLGAIGSEVAKRARAFGMHLIAFDRVSKPEKIARLGIQLTDTAEELMRKSDAVSLHLPLNPATKGLVSRALLEAMKPGAFLINTARAEVVDQEALAELAAAGRIRVAQDVWPGEPEAGAASFAPPLAKAAYGTHHIGASTEQAQDAIAQEAVRILRMFAREGSAPNVVNIAKKTQARCQLVVRHYDKVGVIANVLEVIKQAGINAQEIENRVFQGAVTASCRIQLDVAPPAEVIEKILSRAEEVIFVDVVELG
jgi:D-3-phosphoglycerate dehydrogenase / 2-oxoglutarate reductase